MSKLGTTLAFLGVLIILALADTSLTQTQWWQPSGKPTPKTVITAGTVHSTSSETASSTKTSTSGNSSTSSTVGSAATVQPDLMKIFTKLGYDTQTTREKSIVEKVIPAKVTVQSVVLLKENDRVMQVSWIDVPEVKLYFSALKEALHGSFTDRMIDLVDETQERPNKPVRNVLSFLDPNIHEDRLLFVRVRQRLYEFHITQNQEPAAQTLMDALTE